MKKGMNTVIKKYMAFATALLLVTVLAAGGAGGTGPMGRVYADQKEDEGHEEDRIYIQKRGITSLSEEEKEQKGKYPDARERIAHMQLVAEDAILRLYLDPDFAEFAVEEKATGECWFSNPYDWSTDGKAGSDIKNTLQALVSLTYYDLKAKEGKMNSFTDCTAKDQYVIEKLDNGFALHMEIGRVQKGMLVPSTVEASKFEEIILPNISDRNARRLNSYYTKVSLSDASLSKAAKEGYLELVPGLSEYDFYLLRNVVEREKRVIEEIIRETAYTEEDMQEDMALSGYEDEETASALFRMSLYVELDNGDLKVTVPASSISYDATQYYLASFQLLNYFGAGKYDQEGYLFIPDGSGALIAYNKYGLKKNLYTMNPVYGMDYTLAFDYELNSLSTQNYFPVYGNKEGNKAILAVIEEGEALANVITESGNIISSYETVYPQFYYETAYTVNYTDSTKIKGLYTYHDTNAYNGDYVVRYRFLSGGDADYVGMAKSYRSYLCDRGILTKLSGQDQKAAFYVEALGAVEKTSTWMGIPYVESVPLTTFGQARDILADIQAQADVDLKLRYKGWANGGLYYGVFNGVKVEKSLGGKEGLAALEGYAVQNGMDLYPDVDFFMVGKDKPFDGYSSSVNGVRSIQREIQYLLSPQAMNNTNGMYAMYSVSPYYYKKYMEGFRDDYNRLGLSGVSVGNMGTMLYAEYHRKRAVNRQQARDIVEECLENGLPGQGLMLDGGNAYTLPYVTDLVNVPLYNSAYTLEDESVPFMQLVLHGYVHYAGEALNLSGEYRELFLRSIEYGSSPFFTVAAGNGDLLKKTLFNYCYSVDWNTWKEEVLSCAAEWYDAYDGLENQEMVDHRKVQENVFRTEYEDGTVFYVNYGDAEVEVEDGIRLEAGSYLKGKAQ